MLRLSRLKVAILAVGFSLPGSTASAMTIREFRKLSPPTQSAYVDAAVSMLTSAYATNGNAARGRCIQNWYFGQQGAQAPGRRQIANELEVYETLDPDKYNVENVILGLADQVCGAGPASQESRSNDNKYLIAALSGLAVLIVTPITWYLTKRGHDRKNQLELLNHQINDLYGPLHIACEAGSAAYDELKKKLGLNHGIFEHGQPPKNQLDEWGLWMEHVFAPLNDRREKLLLDNFHLFKDKAVPAHFGTFIRHAAHNKVILAKWKSNDREEQYSKVEFPPQLNEYAQSSLLELRNTQSKLIGRRSR
jgi:hypothetical protein